MAYKLTYKERFKKELPQFGAAFIVFGVFIIYGITSDDLEVWMRYMLVIISVTILVSWQLYNYWEIPRINRWMNRYEKSEDKKGESNIE